MGKVPTAEEFLKERLGEKGWRILQNNGITAFVVVACNNHAKLHVEAALKEALESIPCLGSSTDIATYEEVENAVLNAYPLTNIK